MEHTLTVRRPDVRRTDLGTGAAAMALAEPAAGGLDRIQFLERRIEQLPPATIA